MKKVSSLVSDRRGKAMMPGKMGRNLPMIAQQNPYASSNMSRSLSGYKKGGRVRKYAEAGEVDFDRDDSPEAQEVERSYSAAGVTGSKDYFKKPSAPKKAAVRKMDARASGDEAGPFTYNEDSEGKGTARLAKTKATTQQADETKSGPQEDTRGVSGRASTKYVSKLSGKQKSDNANRLAEELALVALGGGAGRLGIETLRVGRAANAARKLGLEKGNAAATGEGAAYADFASSSATRAQNLLNKYKDSEKTIKRNPDGYKKGGKVAKVAPTRYDRMQDAKLQKHEKEPMQIAHKAKKGGNFAKRKFSRR